jgi:hypothetical protein
VTIHGEICFGTIKYSLTIIILKLIRFHVNSLGCYACTDIAGKVTISSESCTEGSSCRDLKGTVTIGSDSCAGFKASPHQMPSFYTQLT